MWYGQQSMQKLHMRSSYIIILYIHVSEGVVPRDAACTLDGAAVLCAKYLLRKGTP